MLADTTIHFIKTNTIPIITITFSIVFCAGFYCLFSSRKHKIVYKIYYTVCHKSSELSPHYQSKCVANVSPLKVTVCHTLYRIPDEKSLVYLDTETQNGNTAFFHYWQRKINYSTMTHTPYRARKLSTRTADAFNIYEASDARACVCVWETEGSGRICELIRKAGRFQVRLCREGFEIQPYWSAPLWHLQVLQEYVLETDSQRWWALYVCVWGESEVEKLTGLAGWSSL